MTILAAISSTREGTVTVLIRGGDQALFEQIESTLNALVRSGYTRIGLIYGDLKEGEKAPVVGIMADGTIYATIKDAKANTEIKWKAYNLVKDAYEEFVLPLERG